MKPILPVTTPFVNSPWYIIGAGIAQSLQNQNEGFIAG
jgi:hypothetical protein